MFNSKNRKRIIVITLLWVLFLVITFNFDYILSNARMLIGNINEISGEYDSTNCVLILRGEEENYYNSLKDAINSVSSSEDVVLKLQKDIKMNEALTINGKKITIDGSGIYKITYGINNSAYYTGRFFDIKAGATLNLNNIIFDGENNWYFDSDKFYDALNNYTKLSDIYTVTSPLENAPLLRTTLINNNGTLNVNNSIFENYYSNNGSYFIAGNKNTVTNINDSIFRNSASSGSIVTYISGANCILNVNGNSIFENNFVGGNGGIFKIYSGAIVNLNSGIIRNNKGANCNGIVSMTYGSGSSFIINGGVISNNEGVSGPQNGRNAPIYVHNASTFIMNGGIIENNMGYATGGIDNNGSSTATVQLNGGIVRNNKATPNNSLKKDVSIMNDYNLVLGKDMVIDGNITVYGDVVNEGTINGNLTIRLENKVDDYKSFYGNGIVNGNVFTLHNAGVVPEERTGLVNGFYVLCDVSKEHIAIFNYNGGIDALGYTYNVLSLEDNQIDKTPILKKVGYTFTKWYTDPELTVEWDGVIPKHAFNLYAGWEINKHNVSWVVDGKSNVVTYNYGDVINEYPAPSKANYIFGGWTNYNVGMTLPDYPLVFEARWSPVLYNVNFETNGGTLINPVGVYYGNKLTKPNDPILQCKKLNGWYLDELFTKPFDFNSSITGNTTLYAMWDEAHIWDKWTWYDTNKHVRQCSADPSHIEFEEHEVDETGYCSVCRNFGYLVAYKEEVIEDEVTQADKNLVFSTNGTENKLVELKINGKNIDSSKYTFNKNSEIILKQELINELKTGDFDLTVVYEDGEATCQFRISEDMVEEETPKFNYLWLLLLLLLILITLYIIYKRKHKKQA